MGLHKVKGKGWRYDFTLNGKRYSKAWFPTKKEAIAAREEHKKQIANTKPKQIDTTFSSLANDYLDYAERRFVKKTYEYKASVYRNFIQICGDIGLAEITVNLVERYLSTRTTNANYNKHRKDLCALFQWAWKRKMISENPCLYISQMPTGHTTRPIYSQEDIAKLFLAAGEQRTFLLALFSLAARLNEINRLRWEDVNFSRREVTLWTRKGTGDYRPQVKPLNDELYNELSRMYDKKSSGWIFPNGETGKPYVNRWRRMRTICKEAGIDYRGFHAIRHFAASLLSDIHKMSLPTVQKMLGHSRLTTTERYVRSLSEGVREAGELLSSSTQQQHTEKKVQEGK